VRRAIGPQLDGRRRDISTRQRPAPADRPDRRTQDQERRRHTYNPSYYKRGLQNAIDRGGRAVADYILRYLAQPPSNGYRKLEDADSLDLACEALIADSTKPYVDLFTDEQREAARERLAHHLAVIEQRASEREARIDARRSELPGDLTTLKALAKNETDSETAIAVNEAIVTQDQDDVAAYNRLGRAYAGVGSTEPAGHAFARVLDLDPGNSIATRRLAELERKQRQRP
jgi:tetratricopeptide (TPR) repeat protein